MLIFSSAVLIINNVWSGNLFRIKKARLMNTTALLLQKKMTELEIKYKDQPLTSVPESESGDFGSDYPGYKWTMTSKEFEMPDMTSAMKSQEGGVDETTLILIKTMTEFINKSIKELKLSITVPTPRAKKPLQYSISTLLVNYDESIAIPGVGGGGAAGGNSNGEGQ